MSELLGSCSSEDGREGTPGVGEAELSEASHLQRRQTLGTKILMDKRHHARTLELMKDAGMADLSVSPTEAELDRLQPIPLEQLPTKYSRPQASRVFANRALKMEKIDWIGFDMDYTLAVYRAPEYDSLLYDVAVKRLIEVGYPESISTLKFDPNFPIRGLFLDSVFGNLLKVDRFGTILLGLHGRNSLKRNELLDFYPTGMVHRDDMGKRFYLLDTLFHVPEACLYADLVSFFEVEGHREQSTLFYKGFKLSFTNLFQDIRQTIDHIHQQGDLKRITVENLSRYVERNPNAPKLMRHLRAAGKKLFLLTNSGFDYTQKVMTYLFSNDHPDFPSWKDYFDVIIVSGRKPLFFDEGTPLRMVNEDTGQLHLSNVEHFERGCVYNGGSLELFRTYTGATGDRVLYVGDHIFSDIIVTKRTLGWRTLLVVRELQHELTVAAAPSYRDCHSKLKNLEFLLAEMYRDLDMDANERPDSRDLVRRTRLAARVLDRLHNQYFGSLFRTGSQRTFFAYQVERYADLYSSDYVNLLNYPAWYVFNPVPAPLAHE